ncbi:MAG: YbjN domain-containing protein [Bacteroidales bacterium]
MINTIETILQEKDLNYNVIHNRPHQRVLRMGFTLENGRCDTIIDIRTGTNTVLIYCLLPIMVPANHRQRIAEFITRANYSIILGNFEMDFNDGEVRYKNAFIYDEYQEISDEAFLRYLFTSLHTLDIYLPGFMAVIYGGVIPLQAISTIEGKTDPTKN